MTKKNSLSKYKICPCCNKDIYKHKETFKFIFDHGEEIKREIEVCKESYTPELYLSHLTEELKKFTKKILDKERRIRNWLEVVNREEIMLLESWKNIVGIYKNELLGIGLENKSSNLGNSKPEKASFNWLSNPEKELPLLFEYLISNNLIDKSTSFQQFNAVFTAKPLNEIYKPIKWIGSKGLLAYFIDQMQEFNKIPLDSHLWSIGIACFTGAENLVQSRNLYEKNKTAKPKNYSLIDKIFTTL